MPQIPNMRPQGISPRVTPGPRLERADATAQALTNLGGETARIGTELLQRRREFQARNYARQTHENRQRDRNELFTELSRNMDPATGVLNDGTGRTLSQAMTEWEDEQDIMARDAAPTSDAREMFLQQDANARARNLLNVDQFQNAEMVSFTRRKDIEDVETVKKRLLSEENDSEVAPKALEAIENVAQNIASNTGTVYTQSEGQILAEKLQAGVSTKALESLIDREMYGDVLEELRHYLVTNEEAQEAIQNEQRILLEQAVNSLGEDVSIEDGLFTDEGYFFMQLEDQTLVYDPEKGGWITDEEALQKHEDGTLLPTDIRQGMIFQDTLDVEGEIADRDRLEDFIDAPTKLNFLRKAMRGLQQRRQENTRALRRKHNDLLAAFSTPGPDRIDINSPEGENLFENHIRDIFNNIEDEDEAERMSVALSSAVVTGGVLQELPLASRQRGQTLIQNTEQTGINNLIERGLLPAKWERDPSFRKQAELQLKEILTGSFEEMLKRREQDPGGWVVEHDPKAARLARNMFNSPEEYNQFRDHVVSRQEDIEIIPFSQTPFPNKVVAREAVQLQEFLNHPGVEGVHRATNWLSDRRQILGDDFEKLVERMGDHGVKEADLYAAALPPSSEAQQVREKIWINNRRSADYARDAAVKPFLRSIEEAAYNHVEPFMRGQNVQFNFGGQLPHRRASLKVMADEMSRRIIEEGWRASSDRDLETLAADVYKELFNSVYYTAETGDGGAVNIPRPSMEKHGLEESKINDAFRFYQRPLEVLKRTDPRDVIPQLKEEMDRMGLDEPSQVQLMEQFIDQGDIEVVTPYRDEAIHLFFNIPGYGAVSAPAREGQQTTIPFREIKETEYPSRFRFPFRR